MACQPARIRRDHGAFRKSALVGEIGYAEAGILVGLFDIAQIVLGFRHTPRHTQLIAIFLLPANDQSIGLFQKAAGRRAHDERRHQIFEHRSRPRDQTRAAMNRRQRTSEMKPVFGGDIAFRNRHETGKPRFGREQVVVTGIKITIRAAIADGQQLAPGIEQEGKIHRIEQARCMVRDRKEPMRHGSSSVCGLVEGRRQGAILLLPFPMPGKNLQCCLALLRECVECWHRVQCAHHIDRRHVPGSQVRPGHQG